MSFTNPTRTPTPETRHYILSSPTSPPTRTCPPILSAPHDPYGFVFSRGDPTKEHPENFDRDFTHSQHASLLSRSPLPIHCRGTDYGPTSSISWSSSTPRVGVPLISCLRDTVGVLHRHRLEIDGHFHFTTTGSDPATASTEVPGSRECIVFLETGNPLETSPVL